MTQIYTHILPMAESLDIADDPGMNFLFSGEYELLKIIQIPEAKQILFLFQKVKRND